MSRLSFLLVLLAACQEYAFSREQLIDEGIQGLPPQDSPGGTDTSDSDAGQSGCEEPQEPAAQAVTLNAECEAELNTGSFGTPQVEWFWDGTYFCGPPAVGQIVDTNGSGAIDDEDMPIILIYQEGRVVALYGNGAGVAWETSATYGQDGGFAVGDLDEDGWPEVVTASEDTVCSLDGQDGSRNWCTSGLEASLDPNGVSYPAIAAMNDEGGPEVTVGDAILDGSTGALVGQGGLGTGSWTVERDSSYRFGVLSVPADLDGDGQLELITGNAAYDRQGDLVWSNDGDDGLVAVADFDGDGQGEVVKAVKQALLVGMESDGSEVWSYHTEGGSPPAIDDLDGDGRPEIVFSENLWLTALEWGGAVLWRVPADDRSTAAGPILFDFDQDGLLEVIFTDMSHLRVFSGLDGSVKYESEEFRSNTLMEIPIVADVDNDGQAEIVTGQCAMYLEPTPYGSLTVYGDAEHSWPPARKVWNQHAYYISNIDDRGGIPSPTEPNYALYNNFRSANTGRPPGQFWDLRAEVLEVCEDECEQGTLQVAARPANAGNEWVPAGISISLRAGAGGEILATTATTEAIPAVSTGEMVLFEVDAEAIGGTQPIVTTDEDASGLGRVYECDEGNNADAWPETVCD